MAFNVDEFLEHVDGSTAFGLEYGGYLEHYGRQGMKWYQHIFGEEDPRGKYARQDKKIERQKKNLVKYVSKRGYDPYAEYKNKTITISDAVRTAAKIGAENSSYKHDEYHLKRGEHAQRISKVSKENDQGHAYITFKELDNDNYMSRAGDDDLFWMNNWDDSDPNNPEKNNHGFALRLKITNDIVAPSYEKAMEAFLDTINGRDMEELGRSIFGDPKDPKNSQSTADKKEYKERLDSFVKSLEKVSMDDYSTEALKLYTRSMMGNAEERSKFFKRLEKDGYNAVVDYNDIQMLPADESAAPLIVFDRSKTLKQESSAPITWREKEQAEQRMYNWADDWNRRHQK